MVLTPSLDAQFHAGTERNADIIEALAQRTKILLSLKSGFVPQVLELLVTISGMLSQDDYQRLAPLLWHGRLDNKGSEALASVSFLYACQFNSLL